MTSFGSPIPTTLPILDLAIKPNIFYLCGMDQEEPEIGRFQPKGDPNEPREPFFPDEMMQPSHKGDAPSVKELHLPKEPLTKETLSTFLIELKPIAENLQELSREDQHLVATSLQEVKNLMHASEFSQEMKRGFEKIVDHFNELLVLSRPIDQDDLIAAIEALQSYNT